MDAVTPSALVRRGVGVLVEESHVLSEILQDRGGGLVDDLYDR